MAAVLALHPACAGADPPANGVWAAAKRDAPGQFLAPDDDGYRSNPPFFFDGITLTLSLTSEHEWMWKTPDGYYRVQTRWQGNDLYWLPPFGGWAKFSTFANGEFQAQGEGIAYRKLDPARLPAHLAPLVASRPVHDYRIKPTDGLSLSK